MVPGSIQLFENVQWGIDEILDQCPSAEVVVFGDFNDYHKEGLGFRTTDHQDRHLFNMPRPMVSQNW